MRLESPTNSPFRPRLCENPRHSYKLRETSQKSQVCFRSARFRRLNFAELNYGEVGFCFYTGSVVTSRWISAASARGSARQSQAPVLCNYSIRRSTSWRAWLRVTAFLRTTIEYWTIARCSTAVKTSVLPGT
jgi:hypothetical protein